MIKVQDSWNPDTPRILCICPDFAPKRDSEAFCSTKFVNALAHSGADITAMVYAKAEPNVDRSQMWDSIKANVVRIPPPTPTKPLTSLSNAVRYHTWLWARWIGESVRQAKKFHAASPFDIVYSRSLPMFGQIAGYWCSKVLKLPWIANLNDPWDYHQFPVGTLVADVSNNVWLSNFWMRRTLRSADLVTYPSERLRSYQSALSSIPHRSLIIPHVGNSLAPEEEKVISGNNGIFHLVHAGKLGSNEFTGRSTAALLEGLRLFLDECNSASRTTKFTLVGPEDQVTQARVRSLNLDGIVTSLGRLDYEQTLQCIRSASVCLLVEAEMAEGIFLPSKVVDYISARKPILALSPRVGVVADLVDRGGISRVDAGDAFAIKDAIRGYYADFQSGTLNRRAPTALQVEQFEPHAVAKKFLDHLRLIVLAKREGRQLPAV